MLTKALLASSLLGFALAQNRQWVAKSWTSKALDGNTESISEGAAYQCDGGPMNCEDNAQCGSAMCIKFFLNKVEEDENEVKKCGCGHFEERFNNQQVQTCSCMGAGKKETCLPIWKRTIMCKFACTSCKGCREKVHPLMCNEDALCVWTADATNSMGGECKPIADPCILGGGDNPRSEEECKKKRECKWVLVNQHYTMVPSASPNKPATWLWKEITADAPSCVSRMYAEVDMDTASPDHLCPLGTERLEDRYQKWPETNFDVCVRKNQQINFCEYYAWDGESCMTCDNDYIQAQVALERGNGRIKQNAICVLENSPHNENCAIFDYKLDEAGKRGGGERDAKEASGGKVPSNRFHHCARCKEEYEWHRSEGDTTAGLCVPKHVEHGETFTWAAFRDAATSSTTFLMLGAGVLGLAASHQLRRAFNLKAPTPAADRLAKLELR